MSDPKKAEAKPWGAPLFRLDRAWTALERGIAVFVILAEIVTLVLWVSVKGLASYYSPDGSVIGLIYRSILTSIVLALIAHFITRPRKGRAPSWVNPAAVTAAAIAGLLLGKVWVHGGAEWASNAAAWLLNASVPMLVGGPRGIVTRLTLWLALLGGSMAASAGKHINIDIATRYLPQKLLTPVAILGWVAAAVVCFAASYGFVDSIAVTKFRAEAFRSCPKGVKPAGGDEGALCDTTFGERLEKAGQGIRTDLFLLGRQLSLDVRSLPRVLAGQPYDRYLRAREWNAWVKGADWEAHFPKEAVAALYLPEDQPDLTKMPAVVAPDTGEGRDLLIRDLNFILPFGLLIIGLKFLLRTVLVLSGHVRVDPGAAHDEQDLAHAHAHDEDVRAAAKGAA